MCIKSTINIRPDLLKAIQEVSSDCHIKMDEIIALLIIKTMHKPIINDEKMFETVKYQGKDKSIKWRKLHVSYDEDIYEEANDLRKVLKRSISRIVAEGIREFLGEIVRELCSGKKGRDNYPRNYIFTSDIYNGIYYFTIFWGFPPSNFLKKYIK